DAAKEILVNEGVSNVSVRKVGEVTGYSYATIYNYFKNLDHLLWCTGLEFIQDIIGIYDNGFAKARYSVEDLKELFIYYMDYYFSKPNVFRFFFFYQIINPADEIGQEFKRPSLEKYIINILEDLAGQNIIKKEEVKIISSLITNAVHGLLLMYFSNKRTVSKDEIKENAVNMIEFLLKGERYEKE
ncbi:MAG: TetR/AcrR family transcriptional regulator, partial [Bacillota bacterium]|nr:TetR/AcrR family transcriptional regulator [Bacillota bacterium]